MCLCLPQKSKRHADDEDKRDLMIRVSVLTTSPWQQKQTLTAGGVSYPPLAHGRLAAVDAKGHQAEEDGDADQRGGGGGGEELAVLDLTVPQHGQHEHEQRDHQAAHVQRHAHLVSRSLAPRRPPRRVLRDVAVQHAVMSEVQRGERLRVVLQQLALIDETHLMLLPRKVGPAGSEVRGQQTGPKAQAGGGASGLLKLLLYIAVLHAVLVPLDVPDRVLRLDLRHPLRVVQELESDHHIPLRRCVLPVSSSAPHPVPSHLSIL